MYVCVRVVHSQFSILYYIQPKHRCRVVVVVLFVHAWNLLVTDISDEELVHCISWGYQQTNLLLNLTPIRKQNTRTALPASPAHIHSPVQKIRSV